MTTYGRERSASNAVDAVDDANINHLQLERQTIGTLCLLRWKNRASLERLFFMAALLL